MKKVDYPASTEHGEKKSQKISFRSSDFSKSKQPSKIDDCPDDPTRAEAAWDGATALTKICRMWGCGRRLTRICDCSSQPRHTRYTRIYTRHMMAQVARPCHAGILDDKLTCAICSSPTSCKHMEATSLKAAGPHDWLHLRLIHLLLFPDVFETIANLSCAGEVLPTLCRFRHGFQRKPGSGLETLPGSKAVPRTGSAVSLVKRLRSFARASSLLRNEIGVVKLHPLSRVWHFSNNIVQLFVKLGWRMLKMGTHRHSNEIQKIVVLVLLVNHQRNS